MNCDTHKLIVVAVATIALTSLLGAITLIAFGKTVPAELVGLGGVTVGGLLGHLGQPKTSDNAPADSPENPL